MVLLHPEKRNKTSKQSQTFLLKLVPFTKASMHLIKSISGHKFDLEHFPVASMDVKVYFGMISFQPHPLCLCKLRFPK